MTDQVPRKITGEDLKLDFRLFLVLIWRRLGLPDPTPIQMEMAEYLQHGSPKLMVMAFRGAGKSWITAAYAVWVLFCDPSMNVLVVSANAKRSGKFTAFVLRMIAEIPELQHLRPRHTDRKSSVGFDVAPAPAAQSHSCSSVGITGNMTGDRADLVIFDDIEVPSNSETAAEREKIAVRSKEASALLKPGGRILYLGTPQCQETGYEGLPDRGFDIRVWPILYPTPEQVMGYQGRLAPSIDQAVAENPELVGTSTEPSRFTMEDIEARKLDYGAAGFALQFMLDSSLADVDKYPLKQKDLLVFPLDFTQAPTKLVYAPTKENECRDIRNVGMRGDRIYRAVHLMDTAGKAEPFTPYARIIMAIDPSGRGADETGYAVLATLGGFIYLLDAGGVPDVEEGSMRRLCEIAEQYAVQVVACEPNYGGGTFTMYMSQQMQKYGYACNVRDAEWARGSKNQRIIEVLRPVLGGHKLVVDEGLFARDHRSVQHLPEKDARNYRLFYQLTNITHDKGCIKHDDRVEAVAIGVTELKREISIDPGSLEARRNEEALEEQLRETQRRLDRRAHRGPKKYAPRI